MLRVCESDTTSHWHYSFLPNQVFGHQVKNHIADYQMTE